MKTKYKVSSVLVVALAILLAGCSANQTQEEGTNPSQEGSQREVVVGLEDNTEKETSIEIDTEVSESIDKPVTNNSGSKALTTSKLKHTLNGKITYILVDHPSNLTPKINYNEYEAGNSGEMVFTLKGGTLSIRYHNPSGAFGMSVPFEKDKYHFFKNNKGQDIYRVMQYYSEEKSVTYLYDSNFEKDPSACLAANSHIPDSEFTIKDFELGCHPTDVLFSPISGLVEVSLEVKGERATEETLKLADQIVATIRE
jgi:hypothetical protein